MRRRVEARELGSAYVLALAVLLVATGLGLTISRIGSTERLLGRARAHRQAALLAAEGGVEIATARLLAGAPSRAVDVELAADPLGPATLVTRVEVAPPSLVAIYPCASCEPDQGVARVGFQLSAVGVSRAVGETEGSSRHRDLARVDLETTLTLQPWPEPGGAAGPAGGSTDPRCGEPDVVERIWTRLATELNPARCRLSVHRLEVLGRDPETDAVCALSVPVCALLSDWRERGPE